MSQATIVAMGYEAERCHRRHGSRVATADTVTPSPTTPDPGVGKELILECTQYGL